MFYIDYFGFQEFICLFTSSIGIVLPILLSTDNVEIMSILGATEAQKRNWDFWYNTVFLLEKSSFCGANNTWFITSYVLKSHSPSEVALSVSKCLQIYEKHLKSLISVAFISLILFIFWTHCKVYLVHHSACNCLVIIMFWIGYITHVQKHSFMRIRNLHYSRGVQRKHRTE